MSKLRLYLSTVAHLKPSQVFYRVWRRLGGKTRLRIGFAAKPDVGKADISRISVLPELDFDPVFLARFDVDAIMADRVELLHHEERIDWSRSWHEWLSTPLWRYNLHYCEYLLPLAKAYLDTGDRRCVDKGKAIVDSWIAVCPEARGGWAWDPYVISMRIVNWLAFYGELRDELGEDEAFVNRMNASLAEQYVYLSQHLEKDLLANHYLENLKALVLLACYFGDGETLGVALPMLQRQIDEQILPDGMHFELSPMYHKIVLEDLLRVATALRACGHDAGGLVERFRLQDMCDCLYSMERGTNRTPLFNDCGDNVAKSCNSLLICALTRFDVKPEYRNVFRDAGYCFLEGKIANRYVKVIFDAGAPGPLYALGHAHCDALSLEIFVDGEPWIVNRGTYAYQDKRRLEFKGTVSHSVVQAERMEQSECWAFFRMARMARVHSVVCTDKRLSAVMRDYTGNVIVRAVELTDYGVKVVDKGEANIRIAAHFHVPGSVGVSLQEAQLEDIAPCFGVLEPGFRWSQSGLGEIVSRIDLIHKSIRQVSVAERGVH